MESCEFYYVTKARGSKFKISTLSMIIITLAWVQPDTYSKNCLIICREEQPLDSQYVGKPDTQQWRGNCTLL